MHKIIKFFHKYKYPFIYDKRQRFAIQSIVLTAGILITQLAWQDHKFLMAGLMSLLSYVLTIWSLYEDINGIEWILLFVEPVFFTLSISLFYFLLPGRWITRLLLTIIFVVGTYAALLIQNIYNVASARSIQLLRAAQSVGLLITLTIIFLLTNIVFSIKTNFWINPLILTPFIFLLALHSLWSIKLDTNITGKLLIYSTIITLGVGELIIVLSFWPIRNTTASLFVTASFYALIGISQQYFLERLFHNTIREYIFAFAFTLIITVITTSWG